MTLKVYRDGQEITLKGRLPHVGRVTERQGLYVSGVLFAPAGFRDNRELNVAEPLIVHHVERGSLVHSLEIEEWDVLVKVNGKPVRGLEELHERVAVAQEAGEPVVLILKRLSGARDQLYDYVERALAIEGAKVVGGIESKRLALKR